MAVGRLTERNAIGKNFQKFGDGNEYNEEKIFIKIFWVFFSPEILFKKVKKVI